MILTRNLCKASFTLAMLCLLLLSATSCRDARLQQQQADGDTLALAYARNLEIVQHEGYTTVTLVNPWKPGKTLHTYVLVPRDAPLPDNLPQGTVLRTPLQRAAVFTTVHCALLMALEKNSAIAGIADLKYIKVPWIRQQVKAGTIADFGDGMSPVIEKIIDAKPDAILLSPFENSGGYGKIEEIDVPIVECAEYMEASPLARAEWVKFYGLLFGCVEKANQLFAQVDSNYLALCQKAQQATTRPKVLVDKQTGPVWYVPGGHSTIGRMLADANADYPWADNEQSGSVSLPFETVLSRAGDADVWLFRFSADHPISAAELLSEQHGYTQLRPVQTGQLWGCNVELSQFYEESPFRPDWLLEDFIAIFHPEIGGLHAPRYYEKVKK